MRAVLLAIPCTIFALWSTTAGIDPAHDEHLGQEFAVTTAEHGLKVLAKAVPALLVGLGIWSRHDR